MQFLVFPATVGWMFTSLKVANKMLVKDLNIELETGIYIINGKKYLIK